VFAGKGEGEEAETEEDAVFTVAIPGGGPRIPAPGTRMSFGANIIGGEVLPAPLAAFGGKAKGDGIGVRGGGVKIETRPMPRGMWGG
jgi:hypothetical protein